MRSRLEYLINWVVLMGTMLNFYFFYNFSLVTAIIDGLVVNMIYMLFGIGSWFIVKLSDFFRLSLKNNSGQFTTLDREIEYSMNHLENEPSGDRKNRAR